MFSKYAWAISLKDKKGITTTDAFQKLSMGIIGNQAIWIDRVIEFCNKLKKSWVLNNDI